MTLGEEGHGDKRRVNVGSNGHLGPKDGAAAFVLLVSPQVQLLCWTAGTQ